MNINSNTGQEFKDLFSTQGRYIPEGDNAPMGLRPKDLKIVLATVTQYDSRKNTIHVNRFNGQGPVFNVSLTQPFSGTNSYITGIPDVGSVVVLGDIMGKYYPLAYLPIYEAGLEAKYIKKWKDTVTVAGKNDYFFRYKRMAPGEIAIGSSYGAEMYLNEHLKLEDGAGDEILLRRYDHSVINTSVNNYKFAGGVWSNAGIIYRNALESSNTDEGQFAVRETNPEGKNQYLLVSDREEGLANRYYSEYLVEVESQAFKVPPANDVNTDSDGETRIPSAVLAMGNFVGNSPNKLSTYGKLLGVQLFKSPDDIGGIFNLAPMSGEAANTYGIKLALYAPSDRNYEIGTFMGVDKEGHYYQYIQSASGGGLGTGRSISILADGSKKEQLGQESAIGNSWDLTTQGGIRWVIGNHSARDDRYKEKSIDIRTTKGIFTYYGAPPEDLQNRYVLTQVLDSSKTVNNTAAYKKVEIVNGRERNEINGNKESTISGSDIAVITGGKDVRMGESYNLKMGKGMNVTVQDTYSVNVSAQKLENFASRKTTVTKGDSELTVALQAGNGNILETIECNGNKETVLTKGDITESILTQGNREFRTTTGNFLANISTKGDITLKTKSGNAQISTLQGDLDLRTRLGNATLESSITSKVKGLKVVLEGRTGGAGGVITARTHKDYITGAFLVGSTTVTATR